MQGSIGLTSKVGLTNLKDFFTLSNKIEGTWIVNQGSQYSISGVLASKC